MRKRKSVKEDEVIIEEAFRYFIQDGRIRNLSGATELFYQTAMVKFQKTFPNVKTINQITKELYNEYVLTLKAENIKMVTVSSYVRGIRTFFNWLMNNEYIKTFKMPTIKAEKDIKEGYTDEELKLLLKKPTRKEMQHSYADYRTWVVINYLMCTGNRANTIINLKVSDVNLYSGYINLRVTKNKKQQVIPLTETMVKILSEYIQLSSLKDENWLFPSIFDQKLTVHALGQAIEKYNMRRGVERKGIHLFRHTFAKKWIMGGGEVFTLQKIMGHSDIRILQEYVQLFGDDIRANNDIYNPLETLSKMREKKNVDLPQKTIKRINKS